MIAFQGVPAPPDNTAYAWIAFVAILGLAAVSIAYDKRQTDRINRSETREDAMREDSRTQTGTMRDLADQQEKIVDAVEKAVSGAIALDAKLDAHHKYVSEKLDANHRELTDRLANLERTGPTASERRRP